MAKNFYGINPFAKREKNENPPFSFNDIRIDRCVEGFDSKTRRKIAVLFGPDKNGGYELQGGERIRLHTFISPDTNNIIVMYLFSYTKGFFYKYSSFDMLTQDEKGLIQEMANDGMQKAANIVRIADYAAIKHLAAAATA